jgi:hypothetical protein
MNPAVKFGLAAAAVLVIALAGYNLLPGVFGPGGPSLAPTLEPTTASTTGPTASPVSSRPPIVQPGVVAPGTYTIVSDSNTLFAITVPAGWSYDGGALSKGDAFFGNGVAFAPWIVTHVYGDSCNWDGTLREAGSKDELVALLRSVKPFRNPEGPDTLLGSAPDGYPAAFLQFSLAADADISGCDEGFARLWADVGGSESGGMPIHVGHTINVWVLETNGKPTAMVAIQNDDSEPAAITELLQMVASIRIPG